MKRFFSIIPIFIFIFSATPQIQAQLSYGDSVKIACEAFIQAENYKKAEETILPASRGTFADSYIFLLLGKARLGAGMFGEAAGELEKVNKTECPEVSYLLAQAYAQTGNARKACENLKIFLLEKEKPFPGEIKNNPNFKKINETPEWTNLWKQEFYSKNELRLAEALYNINTGRDAEAFEILDKMISENKSSAEARYLRSLIHLKNIDLKNAYKDIDAAASQKSNNLKYRKRRADICFKTGKLEQALGDYNFILSKQSFDYSLYKQRARVLFLLNKFQNARSDINNYLNFYSNDAEACFLAGKIESENDNELESLKLYNKSLSLDKSNPAVFEARGDLLYKLSSFEAAEHDYAQSLDLKPEAEVYFKKGLCRLKTNNMEGACRDWNKALDMGWYPAADYLKLYEKE